MRFIPPIVRSADDGPTPAPESSVLQISGMREQLMTWIAARRAAKQARARALEDAIARHPATLSKMLNGADAEPILSR